MPRMSSIFSRLSGKDPSLLINNMFPPEPHGSGGIFFFKSTDGRSPDPV